MYKKDIYLDIDDKLNSYIKSVELDSNSRVLHFHLTVDYSPLDLTGKTVQFRAEKPDKTNVLNDCKIIDAKNGIVKVELTQQVNAVPGHVYCLLKITGSDGYVLKTKTFIIEVSKTLGDEPIVSSNEFRALDEALEKVRNIDQRFAETNAQLSQKANVVDVRMVSDDIDLNDLSERTLEAIQGGDGTSFELLSIPRDYSVDFYKTTFIQPYPNLFNPDTAIDGYNIVNGVCTESASYCTTDYIKVDLDTTYITENVTKVNYFDVNKEPIGSTSLTSTNNTFYTQYNREYVRLSILLKNKYIARFEKGDTLSDNKLFGGKMADYIDIPSKRLEPIDVDKLNFIKKSSNLFNKNTVKLNTIVDKTGAEIESTSGNCISDFIEVTPNTVYSFKKSFVVVRYSSDKEFISRPDSSNMITTPEDCHYVRLMMKNTDINDEQFNLGSELQEYEEYYVWFDENKIIPPSSLLNKLEPDPIISDQNFYFVPENIPYKYNCNLEDTVKIDDLDDYYKKLDDLISNNEDYITKEFLGNDSSGSYPINVYKLTPNNVTMSRLTKKIPKIVIICGVHGCEKSSIYSCYYLIKDICENWLNDEALEYLRWNCELVILPIANPYGFSVQNNANWNGRKNSNGVDINRNLSARWELNGTVDSETYSGEYALSEVESQYITKVIDDNQDAIYVGDYHTNNGGGDDYSTLMWHSQPVGEFIDTDLDIASTYFIGKMSREYVRNYSLPVTELNFGYASYSNTPGSVKMYACSKGLHSNTFECFKKFPSEIDIQSDTTIKACTEYLGTWILTVLKQLENYCLK